MVCIRENGPVLNWKKKPPTWVISWWSLAESEARRLSSRARGTRPSSQDRLGLSVKVALNLKRKIIIIIETRNPQFILKVMRSDWIETVGIWMRALKTMFDVHMSGLHMLRFTRTHTIWAVQRGSFDQCVPWRPCRSGTAARTAWWPVGPVGCTDGCETSRWL